MALKRITLITNFDEHPTWCEELPSCWMYGNFHLGEYVLDINKTECKIIHISTAGNFRLLLENGASTSAIKEIISHLTPREYDDEALLNLVEEIKNQ